MESILILVGVLSQMSVVALRQDLAAVGSTNRALVDVARSLLALHDQTALLGPQFCAGLGNGVLLGYLMWRSKLLLRPLVMFGVIGGSIGRSRRHRGAAGAWDLSSRPLTGLTVLEVVWEFSLSVWLLTRGLPAVTDPHWPAAVPSQAS